MTDGSEQPQEVKEVPQETQEVAEARQELDRATLEPAAAVEKAIDIKTSETLEAAVREAVEAAGPAADGGRQTEDGEVAVAGAIEEGEGQTSDAGSNSGNRAGEADTELSPDEGPDVKTDDGQNQAQRLVQGQGDRALNLGNVGTSTEGIQRDSNEEVIKAEGAPRSDPNDTPPPPEIGETVVPPSAPVDPEDLMEELLEDVMEVVSAVQAEQEDDLNDTLSDLEDSREAQDGMRDHVNDLRDAVNDQSGGDSEEPADDDIGYAQDNTDTSEGTPIPDSPAVEDSAETSDTGGNSSTLPEVLEGRAVAPGPPPGSSSSEPQGSEDLSHLSQNTSGSFSSSLSVAQKASSASAHDGASSISEVAQELTGGYEDEPNTNQAPVESSEEKTSKAGFGTPAADPARSYSGVEMSQGEVAQDSDWNETLSAEGEMVLEPSPAAISEGLAATGEERGELVIEVAPETAVGESSEPGRLANEDLQNMLQKQQQLIQMMSQIAKAIHDTENAVIRKMDDGSYQADTEGSAVGEDPIAAQAEGTLQEIGDQAQLEMIDLQNALPRQQQLIQMMSNLSKMMDDTAMSLIRNIGGDEQSTQNDPELPEEPVPAGEDSGSLAVEAALEDQDSIPLITAREPSDMGIDSRSGEIQVGESYDDLEAVQDQLSDLLEAILASLNQLKILGEELRNTRDEIKALRDQITELTAEIGQIMDFIPHVIEENTYLSDCLVDLAEGDTIQVTIRVDADPSASDYSWTEKTLMMDQEMIEARISANEDLISILQDRITSLEMQIDTQHQKVDEKDRSISDLMERIQELSDWISEMQDQAATLSELLK